MAPLPRWYPRLPPRVLDLTLDLDGCWPTPAADVAVTRELVTTAFSLSSVFAAPSTLPHRLPQPLLPVCSSPSAVGPSPPHRPAPTVVAALPTDEHGCLQLLVPLRLDLDADAGSLAASLESGRNNPFLSAFRLYHPTPPFRWPVLRSRGLVPSPPRCKCRWGWLLRAAAPFPDSFSCPLPLSKSLLGRRNNFLDFISVLVLLFRKSVVDAADGDGSIVSLRHLLRARALRYSSEVFVVTTLIYH